MLKGNQPNFNPKFLMADDSRRYKMGAIDRDCLEMEKMVWCIGGDDEGRDYEDMP